MPQTDEPETVAKPGVSPRALALLGSVAVLVYLFDRLSKYWVTQNLTLGEPVEVIGQLLQFRYVENSGAAFSLLSGSTWIFAIIATGVAVVIILFARRIRSVGWAILFGLLLGGTVGNLTDRLTREPGFGRGYVVDFLQIWGFPAIFNIADVAIVSAMTLFIILTLRGVGLDGKRAVRQPKSDASTDGPGASSSNGDSATDAS